MSELIKQWAIRKPDGELVSFQNESIFAGLFGGMTSEPEPRIFDSCDAALSALQSIQEEAMKRYGLRWYGVIEHRLCTPFSVTDPAEQLVSEIEQWRTE